MRTHTISLLLTPLNGVPSLYYTLVRTRLKQTQSATPRPNKVSGLFSLFFPLRTLHGVLCTLFAYLGTYQAVYARQATERSRVDYDWYYPARAAESSLSPQVRVMVWLSYRNQFRVTSPRLQYECHTWASIWSFNFYGRLDPTTRAQTLTMATIVTCTVCTFCHPIRYRFHSAVYSP